MNCRSRKRPKVTSISMLVTMAGPRECSSRQLEFIGRWHIWSRPKRWETGIPALVLLRAACKKSLLPVRAGVFECPLRARNQEFVIDPSFSAREKYAASLPLDKPFRRHALAQP